MAIVTTIPNIIEGEIRKIPHQENYSLLIDNDIDLQNQITSHLISTSAHLASSIANNSSVAGSSVALALSQLLTDMLAHINSLTAHDAQNLVLGSEDPFLTATNIESGLEQLSTRITNIITSSGTSSTEVVDARLSSVYGAFATLATRLNASDVILNNIIVPTRSSTQQTYAPVTTLPTNTKNGLVKGLVKGVSLYNSVVNGDFKNGTIGWTLVNGIIVSNEKLVFQNASALPYLSAKPNIILTQNAKYCVIFDLELISGECGVLLTNTPTYFNASGIKAIVGLSFNTEIEFFRKAGLIPDFKIDNVIIINQTALGLETLTSEQMADLCRNGYFEGLAGSEVDLKVVGANLIDKINVQLGKYLDGNGAEALDPAFCISEYTAVEPSTDYTIRGVTHSIVGSNNDTLAWYDEYKNKLSAVAFNVNGISLNSPTNAKFFRLTIALLDLDTVIVNQGLTSIPYQPFKSSKLQLPQVLHRIPNGVADQYNLETGQLTKNIGSGDDGLGYVIKASDIIESTPSGIFDYVRIQRQSDFKNSTVGLEVDARVSYQNFKNGTFINGIGVIWNDSTSFGINVLPNTYANLAQAQADLSGSKLLYQLETPVITQIDKDLLSFENGTLYNSGCNIEYTTPTNTASTIADQSVVNEHLERRIETLSPQVESVVGLSLTTPTIITRTSIEPQAFETNIIPTHIINPLGAQGNCEVTNKWGFAGANLSLDSASKVFGANAMKITLTATAGAQYNLLSSYNIDIAKYYYMSAYVKNGNATNISLVKDASGGGVLKSSTLVTATSMTRVGFKCQPSDLNGANIFKVLVNGAISQYGFSDALQINEITATEYSTLTDAQLLEKYPYVDSIGTTINPSIKITHADGSIVQSVVEGEFLTGDLVNIVDNQVTGSKLWKKKTLFGKDYGFNLHVDFVGYKTIVGGGFSNLLGGSGICIKPDGSWMNVGSAGSGNNIVDTSSIANTVFISLPDTLTGWFESWTIGSPSVLTSTEFDKLIKAKLNGWKFTGTVDYVTKTWVSEVDGTTAPTVQSSDYVSANLAPNYEGYKLYYKLATPQPINQGSDSYLAPLVGDVLMLESGANSVVFDTGVVLGEAVRPILNAGFTAYEFNLYNSTSNSLLLNKLESILQVKKNGIIDTSWIFIDNRSSIWGNGYVYCLVANYDTSATYTVDYKILKSMSPSVGTCSIKYSDGIVSAIEGVYQILETKMNQSEALDTLVDLSMYEKTTQGLLSIWTWVYDGSYMYITITTPVVRKLSPLPFITRDNIVIAKGNGFTNVTNLFSYSNGYYNDGKVTSIYKTADATTIADIKTYGAEVKLSITIDCRGRI